MRIKKRSERLKKAERELADLEQWLNLDLVPKRELEKHKQEIELARKRVEEEKRRLKELKTAGEGELEETTGHKRGKGYSDVLPTLPDMEFDDAEFSSQDTEVIDPGNTIIIESDDDEVKTSHDTSDSDFLQSEEERWKWWQNMQEYEDV